MRYNIKEMLIQEGVVDHLKRNWGKYALGAGAAGLGAAYGNDIVDGYDQASDQAELNSLKNAEALKIAQGQENLRNQVQAVNDNPNISGFVKSMSNMAVDKLPADPMQNYQDNKLPSSVPGVLYNKYVR